MLLDLSRRKVFPYSPRVVGDLFPGTKEFPERVPYSPRIELYEELKRGDLTKPKQNLFKSNFGIIKRNLLYNPKVKMDWMHLIVGMEGTGKSNCGIRDSAFVDDYFLKQDLKILPQCIYSKRDLDYLLDLVKKKDSFYDRRGITLFFDEAHSFFFGKDSLTKESRAMQKFLMGARSQFPFFYVLVMQYFQDFNTYIRNSRGRSLAETFWVFDTKTSFFSAGYVNYYSKNKFDQIKIDTQTRKPIMPTPDFSGKFPKAPEFIDLPLSLKKLDFLNKEGDYAYLQAQKPLRGYTEEEKKETKERVKAVEAVIDKDYEALIEIQQNRLKKTGVKGLAKSFRFKTPGDGFNTMADEFAAQELK